MSDDTHVNTSDAAHSAQLLFPKRPSRHRLEKKKESDEALGRERREPSEPAATLQAYLKDPDVVAALLDNLTVSLHTALFVPGAAVEPIRADEEEGKAVLRRSLAFLFSMAVGQLWPKQKALLVHDQAHQAYFFTFPGRENVPAADAEALQARMQAIVQQDLPITEEYVRYVDAAARLTDANQPFAARLVRSRAYARVLCCCCDGHIALRHRALAPSTGRLAGFSVSAYREGVLLTFPPSPPTSLSPPAAAGSPKFSEDARVQDGVTAIERFGSGEQPAAVAAAGTSFSRRKSFSAFSEMISHDSVVFELYSENKAWGATLGVECAADINDKIVAGEGRELVMLCEALQDQKIIRMCSEIKEGYAKGVRAVLISGPSTSGKTTLANKLRIQLKVMGLKPFTLGTDDYYRPHSDPDYPRDEQGNLDFEDVHALQLDLLNDHLQRLFEGEEVETPIFDIAAGVAKPKGRRLRLPPGGILIMEGIFCLQPKFASDIPRERKHLIYIAPMTTLSLDECNFISNQPLRLIRRISRDYLTRGRGALETIARWPSVKAGEERNIFPFVSQADAVFNSALDYELAVLKQFSRPLLATVKPDSSEYTVAQDLCALLDQFHELGASDVPSTSLLREFIGGSSFADEG